ncbi:MAG: acetoacetate--CoA ligase [archaeon]|nr:MAG: acetoacetate--CoA ligase [archaeon]
MSVASGEVLWEPGESQRRGSNIAKFAEELGRECTSEETYRKLWQWSVEDLEGFWGAVWESMKVEGGAPYTRVLAERKMPGARWFPGARLNYAQRALSVGGPGPALVCVDEEGEAEEVSWSQLKAEVGAAAAWLRGAGVVKGDRVAAYLPNVKESVVGLLATASLGAVWSSCSPEFGAQSAGDRFRQIGPRVLLAGTQYSYGGKRFDRREAVEEIAASLPTLERTVILPGGEVPAGLRGGTEWAELSEARGTLEFEQVPFDHPLWVLYSSGTTGLPKAIVQGHGGIVLEHLKALSLHVDVRPTDRFFWFTTTGWMMWNFLAGGLLLGATVVLYDGSPTYPDHGALWTLAEKHEVTILGTSAALVGACMKAGISPRSTHRLGALREVGSTGSPLSPEGFRWVYEEVKREVWLASISGGTDLCTEFVGGSPVLPVRAGELQCRCLGAKVEAYDEGGRPILGGTGELVISEPMPSMPLYFWGDEDGSRYRESYFADFPGVWRHGDWIEVLPSGSCRILGRSDATIKRMGVRIGTSELYRVVEALPEVYDSLAVDFERGGKEEILLFVALRPGSNLDAGLVERIKGAVRKDLSPRHVPDWVIEVPSVPRTINGKKLEVPVKKIMMGQDVSGSLSRGSLADPGSVDFFVALARRLESGGKL